MRHDKHHPSYTTFDNISGDFDQNEEIAISKELSFRTLEFGAWNLFVIWNL
jgi:hypothetical protein